MGDHARDDQEDEQAGDEAAEGGGGDEGQTGGGRTEGEWTLVTVGEMKDRLEAAELKVRGHWSLSLVTVGQMPHTSSLLSIVGMGRYIMMSSNL